MNDTRRPGSGTVRLPVLILVVAVLLAGLPLAVWLDLRTISRDTLTRQAHDLNTVITGIRAFYSSDVVARVLAAHGRTVATSNYESIDGAIPIPATFSLELGRVIGADQSNIQYRFVSDYPFKHRAPHVLDIFERNALASLRAQPNQQIVDVSWNGTDNRVRVIAPILMGQTCVDCHNTDPDSPKRDWKVGDVRGIQELSVVAPVATNILSFRWLLIYFVIAGIVGIAFILLQNRQAAAVVDANTELARTNAFLEQISSKISRYLSPQIYKTIFSGQKDVVIQTERKKLTIFFSDIKDFTSTAERLQPEELTALLNDYFTEMSAIALRHGGTIDKFVGDAMLIFFGDPETKGTREDAAACVRMAIEMQQRLSTLHARWRHAGIEQPFAVRMGINTGYCNVGNFGSLDRMDYTIIGAEANLSSRLQSIAEPGHIVISYETYALVRDFVEAHPLPPIRMKGISREVIPYAIDGLRDASPDVFSEHAPGVELYIDPSQLDDAEAERVRVRLRAALDALGRNRDLPQS
jgi:class 3 adenylate cyclase